MEVGSIEHRHDGLRLATGLKAMEVSANGDVLDLEHEYSTASGGIVRREAYQPQENSDVEEHTAIHDVASSKALVQMQDPPWSGVKLTALLIVAVVGLVAVCAATICLMWLPMSTALAERAFAQAAKRALLQAVPTAQDELGRSTREDSLNQAWSRFLESPVLKTERNNLLHRLLGALMKNPELSVHLQDIFEQICTQGASAPVRQRYAKLRNTPPASITTGGQARTAGESEDQSDTPINADTAHADAQAMLQQELERICESISGTLYNIEIKGSLAAIEYKEKGIVSIVVNTVQDYAWLFDNYKILFPEKLPLDSMSFVGVVKLVIAWNCIRTLYTAKHMAERHRVDSFGLVKGTLKNKVALELKIDVGSGIPTLQANAEVPIATEVRDANGSSAVIRVDEGFQPPAP